MQNSTNKILKLFLKKNNFNIDEKELDFQLESHPSYPSLHSITGVLSHFGIQNMAANVPVEHTTLIELPRIFLAYVKSEKKEDFVIAIQDNHKIELIYDNKIIERLSKQDFLDIWTGILVVAEKDKQEFKEKRKKKNFSKIFYYISASFFLFFFFLNSSNLFQIIHFILSITGIVISIFIVQHELGVSSKTINKFCSGKSDKIDCDSVLNSEGANLPWNIKYSDIGFVYFVGLSLSWFLLSFLNNPNYNIIIILSIISLPFIIYSIYYQYFKVKKWCPLCLTIIVILLSQTLSLLLLDLKNITFLLDFKSTFIIVFSFILTISFWMFLLTNLKLKQGYRKLKIDYYKFKNNYNIFNTLLSRNSPLDTTIEGAKDIVFGIKNNPLVQIIIITNPLCGHCKSAHQAIESYLNKNIDDLQIRIRFNVNTKDKNNLAFKIASNLLYIYHNREEVIVIEALNDIYSDMNSKEWLKKWKSDIENNIYYNELETETKWCHQNNINFTPEILINGRPFPIEYNRNELKNFINDIIEEEKEKINSQY